MAQLKVISELLRDQRFALEGEFYTIGRLPENSIQLSHSSVSKHHALLKHNGTDYVLLDLHSTNGVIVNGRRDVAHHLQDGDRITLGEIILRFEIKPDRDTQPLGSVTLKPAPKATLKRPPS